MTVEDTTTAEAAAAEARENADFGAGFASETPKLPEPADKPAAKEPPKPARVEATPEPEKFVQISAKEWNEVKAAAQRTARTSAPTRKNGMTVRPPSA